MPSITSYELPPSTPLLTPTHQEIYRIPALITHRGQLLLTCDRRPRLPAPASWQDYGGALPDDLPNPNSLIYLTSRDGTHWDKPTPIPGAPTVCSDSALGSDGTTLTLLCASSETVGYFGSRFRGPRLNCWIGYGNTIDSLHFRPLDELYEATTADGLFITSGSTAQIPTLQNNPTLKGALAFAAVIRKGTKSWVQVVYIKQGNLIDISNPIECPYPLDEAALLTYHGKLLVNARVRGQGGRYTAESTDGHHWNPSPHFRSLHPETPNVPDPGCRASLLAIHGEPALIHPHTPGGLSDRHSGAIVDSNGHILARLGPGSFGYSDAAVHGDTLTLVHERDHGIHYTQLPQHLLAQNPHRQ